MMYILYSNIKQYNLHREKQKCTKMDLHRFC